MFRHKDRYLKQKRLEKKKNCNKEKKISEDFHGFYGRDKSIQQFLIREHNIKYTKTEIKHNSEFDQLRHQDDFKNWDKTHDMTRWDVSKKKSIEKRKNEKSCFF